MRQAQATPVDAAEQGTQPLLRIGFILAPDFSLTSFSSFLDCIRVAADERDRSRQILCRWSIIAQNLTPVRASCGVELLPHQIYPSPTEFDYIAVTGGVLPNCLDLPDETLAYLRQAHAQGIGIIGLCTGSFILAKAGLLDAKTCAIHFMHHDDMKAMFPEVLPIVGRRFIEDGALFTCPGGTTAIDLAVALIRRHCGAVRANKGYHSMLIDHPGTPETRVDVPFQNLTKCGNWRVERAVEIMIQHISSPFPIFKLAQVVGTSVRELNSAFAKISQEPPNAVWRQIRLAHGQWMLLNTERSVTEISYACGFADTAHFSRQFKAYFGRSPKPFRASSAR